MPLKRYNITGKYIQRARLKEGISQQRLATILQECGFEIDTDLIYRIEAENEFVPDYLLIAFSSVLNVPYEYFSAESPTNIDYKREYFLHTAKLLKLTRCNQKARNNSTDQLFTVCVHNLMDCFHSKNTGQPIYLTAGVIYLIIGVFTSQKDIYK